MINTKLQSIIDTKSAIGNAITNKGGTITTNTPFFNYAAQIDGISTGTPQTIFAASDGSKWALTNAVNLVNSAGNVTHDFNYWQPANNSTSDPILNIGTVGANISGNIRLVPVNQVNISQYVNIVATDTDGAKYVGYNGYDSVSNPTPTGNTTFNQWLLNNSATGTVIFANATIVNGGTFNGPNTSINEASMTFVNSSESYTSGDVQAMAINNGLIFVGGESGRVQVFNESNLGRVANTTFYDGGIQSIAINNGFVYAGGTQNRTIQKFGESNRTFIGNTANYGGDIYSVKTNNGFVYAVGAVSNDIRKYDESNLAFNSNSISYGSVVFAMAINNGFIYIGGVSNQRIRKYHESNLAFDINSNLYGGIIRTIAINDGFVYVGGDTNLTIQKFHESNLVFVGNTPSYGGSIRTIAIKDGFIYAGGATNQKVQKFYESNLAFVGNTANYGAFILSVLVNNSFLYAAGSSPRTVNKYEAFGTTLDTLPFYNITKIKE
jgi:hypothetical protein